MKKFLFCALAFGMVACAKDATDEVPGVGTGETEVNYLSVALSTTLGTRADYDSQSGYVDGEGVENEVSTVRFYFFDANGNGVSVMNGKSYQDWTPGSPNDIEEGDTNFPEGDGIAPNVEKVLQATLILKSDGTSAIPEEILAVLNPTAEVNALTESNNTPTREQVLNHINNFAVDNSAEDENKVFVMSNSVYVDDASNVKNVNSLAGYLKPSPTEAKNNPVVIYVERVVAKVTMNTTGLTGNNLYDTGVPNPTKEGENIYVQFLGYNVTSTAAKSYMVKHISATWNNEINANNLFKTANEPWNWAQFFRSFWAINPTLTDADYVFGPFDSEAPADKVFPPVAGEGYEAVNAANGVAINKPIYVAENAGVSDLAPAQATGHPTYVIIAARLCDAQGVAMPLAEYAGTKMTPELLKGAYLQTLRNTGKMIYRKMTQEELDAANAEVVNPEEKITEGYKEISADDIDFKTAWQVAGEENKPEKGRYYVYAQLNENNENVTEDNKDEYWYDSNAKGSQPITADAANETLKGLGHAKVWTNGDTYYFFNIKHLAKPAVTVGVQKPEPVGAEATYAERVEYQKALAAYNAAYDTEASNTPGYYGVVRNHVYQTKINSLFGLGTPVYDPNEVIYPEIPEEEVVYLAAEIRILAWRIVNQDVDLNWK